MHVYHYKSKAFLKSNLLTEVCVQLESILCNGQTWVKSAIREFAAVYLYSMGICFRIRVIVHMGYQTSFPDHNAWPCPKLRNSDQRLLRYGFGETDGCTDTQIHRHTRPTSSFLNDDHCQWVNNDTIIVYIHNIDLKLERYILVITKHTHYEMVCTF